jgi:DNA (cytosine-5)-methyltransferase 1
MGLKAAFGEINLRFVSDIDKHASTLLAHHHPDIPNLGDLTTVNWEQQDQIDVLTAGYPCQPFSVAGKREGTEDERAIFSYISNALGVLRPRYVFLENVAGHLTLGGVGVIAELTRLGYNNVKWGIIRASETGAAHQRKRLFIWGETKDTNSHRKCNAETGQSRWRQVRPSRPVGQVITNTGSKRYGGGENAGAMGKLDGEMETETRRERTRRQFEHRSSEAFNWRQYETAIRRWETVIDRPAPIPVDDKGVNPVFVEWLMGLTEGWVTDLGLSRSAELKMLGNGVVPQQAHLALEILTEGGVYAT